MRVQARKCRFTGQIFDELEIAKYVRHLAELRVKMRNARQLANIRDTFNAWLRTERAKPIAVAELSQWVIDNQARLMESFNAIHCREGMFRASDKFLPGDKFVTIVIPETKFDNNVSNSHTTPDTGVTNWCNRNPALPSGYPGWKTRVTYKTEYKNRGRSPQWSGLLNMVGLKTGSGGGGGDIASFELAIYLDDWTGLKHQQYIDECNIITSKLKGTYGN